MKKYQLIFLLGIILSIEANAQHLTFTRKSNGTNAISVASGEVWQVIAWRAMFEGGYDYFRFDDIVFYGTSSRLITLDNAPFDQTYPVGLILVGPTSLTAGGQLSNTNYSYYLAIKKISFLSTTSPVSATSVVIPTSTSGDVDVKLEQSADNVTWTECLPGTYNSSTVKRFFRLRAVEK